MTLTTLLVLFCCFAVVILKPFKYDPTNSSINHVHKALTSGASCQTIISQHLEIIYQNDDKNKYLHAMIRVNENALKQAALLDSMRYKGRSDADIIADQPLFCVPSIVKDNYDFVGMPTSAGSIALNNSYPITNSHSVAVLLNNGAVILGKANMAEFATFGTNTMSSLGGQTLNFFRPSHTPYGSSGGSATASAAGYAVIALGTDTSGSIQLPSSAASLVGIRSTLGLVSIKGIAPLNVYRDVSGPLCKTVLDAAKALQVMVDPSQSSKGPQNYVDYVSKLGLQGARLAFGNGTLQYIVSPEITMIPDKQVVSMVENVLNTMVSGGATVISSNVFSELFLMMSSGTDEGTCFPKQFKYFFNEYLSRLSPNAPMKTLSDIVASGKYLHRYGVDDLLKSAADSNTTTDPSKDKDCSAFVALKEKAANFLESQMDKLNISAFIYPPANQRPFYLSETLPPPKGWFPFVEVSAFTGLPAITVPIGFIEELPFGLNIIGRRYQEAELIKIASGLEAALNI